MGSLVPLMMMLPCELHKHKQDFALRTKGGGRKYQDKRFSSLLFQRCEEKQDRLRVFKLLPHRQEVEI